MNQGVRSTTDRIPVRNHLLLRLQFGVGYLMGTGALEGLLEWILVLGLVHCKYRGLRLSLGSSRLSSRLLLGRAILDTAEEEDEEREEKEEEEMQTASLTSPSPAGISVALRERPNRLMGLRLNDDQRSSIRSTLKRNRIGRVRERRVPTASREAAENYLDSGKERVMRNEDLSDRASFLNRLCDLIEGTHPDQLNHKPFFEKISDVMRELLQDDHQSIRAMALRILRLCLFNEHNLVHVLKTNVEIFIVRSLDLRANNEAERVAAFRIIYQLIAIYEKSNYKKLVMDKRKKQKNENSYAFPKSIMQPVIAIGLAALRPQLMEPTNVQSPQKAQCRSLNEKESMEDPLGLPSVALLMEFAVYEPDLTLEMAGTDWMVRVLTGEVVVSRRVATLVTRLFVHWLDSPRMRKKAQMNRVLEQIFAPLVDFGFFNNEAESDESRAKIETTLETFQHTFLAILRSWSGLLACSAVGAGSTVVSSSPIRLIEYLGLGTVISPSLVRIRSMIVDLIVDFLDLPYADKKFTSWKEAHAYFSSLHEPGVFERSLRNDFVIAHADRRAVHDERLRNHVDVLESFRAIAVYILVNASLPQSLCRLILACPDEPSSIKATLLLSDLIGQAATVLPSEWTSRVLSLPTLLHSSCETIALSTATAAMTKGRPLPDEGKERFTFQHAENAPLVLFRMDELQTAWLKCEEISRCPPVPTSLLALFVPRRAAKNEERAKMMDGGRTPSLNDDDDMRIFESLEMQSRLAMGPVSEHLMADILSSLGETVDGPRINWKTAAVFLELMQRDPKMVDRFRSNAAVLSFMEKLLAWLAPSARNLCRAKTTEVLPAAVGKLAIECLMRLAPEEQLFREILEQFANDFVANLRPASLTTGAFSSKHVNFNGSMHYFALLASYASHSLGSAILERAGVMQIFLDLMAESTLAEHVKLIVCSIDYSRGGLARVILNKALTATNEQSRVWCTRFLEVLASLDLPQFADWGVRMMIGQIGDASVKVVRHAVRLLHTWLPLHPSSLPLLRAVPLQTLGDAGVLLRVHLFSCEVETRKNLSAAKEVVDFWMKKFNARYAATVEEEMRMALLGIKRCMDGRFARSSHEKHSRYGVRMPAHLFAALASHEVGRRLLREEGVVRRLTEQLRIAPSTDHKAAMLLKAATLALAHIGAAPRGHLLLSSDSLVLMIRLAEESEVLSVRGAAFAALNVLAGSEEGARMLARFGWESNWYRHVAEEVRAETVNRRTSSRLSHHGGAEVDVRPPSASICRPRLSRVRSALSESERKHSRSDEERRRTSESGRSSSAPSRIRVKEVKKKLTLADRSISALPRVSLNSESLDDRFDDGEGESGGEMEADVPIEVLKGTFGDHDDDAFLPSGQRSRRCTTVSIGPLSPVPSGASFCLDPSSTIGGRTHSESITDCIRYGMRAGRKELTADNGRIFAGEWTRRPHFSSALRQQWKLAPILMTKSHSVNRSFGAPVSYYFMPQTELESLAAYRLTIDSDPWLKKELERTRPVPGLPLMDGRGGGDGGWGEMVTTRRGRSLSDHSTWTNIALPTELEIVCKGIFIEDDAAERKIRANSRTMSTSTGAAEAGHDDNRGQKGGYGRVRLEGKKKKHTSHCFYCTAQSGEVRPFHVPNQNEFNQLRLQVLDAVDLLEIKHALPEKKLLELRRRHPTLFDWPCLYADVLELLDEYRFKAQSRTFLQELFYNALRLTRPDQPSI